MFLPVRWQTALSASALLLLGAAQVHAEDSTLKQDAKTVGQQAGDAVHKVGEAGKEVGKKVAETARDVGHATRDGVKEFGKAVKNGGSSSASSHHTPTATANKNSAGAHDKPVDTSVANK